MESSMRRGAEYWVEKLQLKPHPEGGCFAPAYRSAEQLSKESLPGRFPSDRPVVSSIYYLLEKGGFSAFHRIKSVEIWHYCAGSPLVLHVIDPEGNLSANLLGQNLEQGQSFQLSVEAGCWFGAEVAGPEDFSLVSCIVAPGFDYEDFELGPRSDLSALYPRHSAIIQRLTRT